MKTKILIPIDGTGLSELVPEAIALQMRPEDTEILILQVIEPVAYSAPAEMAAGTGHEVAKYRAGLQADAKDNLIAALETLRKAGFKAESRLAECEIQEGILEAAGEWGANLIIVASHARKGVARFLHASVAEGIIHRAPCNVLVLKEAVAKAAA